MPFGRFLLGGWGGVAYSTVFSRDRGPFSGAPSRNSHDQIISVRRHKADRWGMIQCGHGARFVLETTGELRLRERLIATIRFRGVSRNFADYSHPACADLREDLVGSQTSPGGQEHSRLNNLALESPQ